MTRTLSLLRAFCGLKQSVTPPLRSCRFGAAPPRATHATPKRPGGHGLYCTPPQGSGQSHEIRIQRFGGWVIWSPVSSKGFHTSLLILLRRHRINARIPVYNEQTRIQARWMSNQSDDEKGESGTASEKDGFARYVAKKGGGASA